MRRFLRENSLGLFFGALFLLSLAGQAIAGHISYNDESEYLQFLVFLMATVWVLQRGSPESKPLGKVGRESDEEQMIGPHAKPSSPAWARAGGWRAGLYGNSLLIVMALIFLGSWLAQSLTGWSAYNQELSDHGATPISWVAYLVNADFWQSTLQNWQSEFLAVGSLAVFAVYLRQRGSPESKPVGAAHSDTGVEG